jgi:acetylornithine deacetylase/succinyl-diaminopimelate desuccinylase-like protein
MVSTTFRAHGRDERVGVNDLYDDVRFTTRLVKELTGGGDSVGPSTTNR